MKHLTIIAVAVALTASSCGDSKSTQDNTTYSQPNIEEVDGVQRMSDYHYENTFEWNGATATYTIDRIACDSLATVGDDDGTLYHDNLLTIKVRRSGAVVLNRTFTKKSLSQYIDPKFVQRSVLEGAAFDGVDKQKARFVMSIGLPLSDEYVQLRMTLSQDGTYTIVRDEVVDEIKAIEDSVYSIQPQHTVLENFFSNTNL